MDFYLASEPVKYWAHMPEGNASLAECIALSDGMSEVKSSSPSKGVQHSSGSTRIDSGTPNTAKFSISLVGCISAFVGMLTK